MAPANEAAGSSDDRRIAWARRELGLTSPADQSDARHAFLVQVADEGFAPNEVLLQAFDVLQSDAQVADPPAYGSVERARINQRVERFSERIFLMSPSERRDEWETLQACSGDLPQAAAMLGRLEPALDLDLEQVQLSAEAAELAGHLCELFALPPVKRAERRSAIIKMIKSDDRGWERAARRLASKYPSIAALDAPFIERLANRSRSEKVMRKPPRVKGPPRIKVTKRPWNEDLAQHPWLIVVGLIILANVGRFAARTADNHSSGPSPVYQNYSTPSNSTRDPEELLKLLEKIQSQDYFKNQPVKTPTVPNEKATAPLDANVPLKDAEVFHRIDELYAPSGTPFVTPDVNQLLEEGKAARPNSDVPAGDNAP